MSIAEGKSFDPETLVLLRAAMDEAARALPPRGRTISARRVMARAILNLAALGERNPQRLRRSALAAIAA
jgi:hypothetical protein